MHRPIEIDGRSSISANKNPEPVTSLNPSPFFFPLFLSRRQPWIPAAISAGGERAPRESAPGPPLLSFLSFLFWFLSSLPRRKKQQQQPAAGDDRRGETAAPPWSHSSASAFPTRTSTRPSNNSTTVQLSYAHADEEAARFFYAASIDGRQQGGPQVGSILSVVFFPF
jgi:hypothetical protein